MEIYKRKQESRIKRKKTRSWPRKLSRKKKVSRFNNINQFSFQSPLTIVICRFFLVGSVNSFFFTFLFSFINSHLWRWDTMLQLWWTKQQVRIHGIKTAIEMLPHMKKTSFFMFTYSPALAYWLILLAPNQSRRVSKCPEMNKKL